MINDNIKIKHKNIFDSKIRKKNNLDTKMKMGIRSKKNILKDGIYSRLIFSCYKFNIKNTHMLTFD